MTCKGLTRHCRIALLGSIFVRQVFRDQRRSFPKCHLQVALSSDLGGKATHDVPQDEVQDTVESGGAEFNFDRDFFSRALKSAWLMSEHGRRDDADELTSHLRNIETLV